MRDVIRACFLGIVAALAFLAAGLAIGFVVVYWETVLDVALIVGGVGGILLMTLWSD